MARSTVAVRFTGDNSDLKRATGAADRDLSTFGSKINRVARGAAVAFAGIAVGVAVVGKGAVDAASDLNETLSKSNTVFGDNAKEIEDWADTAAESFGQSKKDALEAASSFGNMFLQLGIGEETAKDMSTSMTELASDFASFHNADITEVLEAQSAAFRGEYDAIQKYVPTINAAAVEQKALEMGLAETTGELTAQDKALATQTLLLEGAGDAMGDFDRTADGAANKQRILSAQVEDVQAKIGTMLLPALGLVVNFLSGTVIPKIEDFVTWLQENEDKARLLAIAVGVVLTVAMLAYAASAASAAFATLAATWPIIAIIIAVAALGALLWYAYNNWEWFRDGVWDAIYALIVIKDWVIDVADQIDSLATSIDNILGPLDELVGQVAKIGIGGGFPGFPGSSLIPGFDDGGVVPGPRGSAQLIMAHGGETVLPTHKSGGGTQIIQLVVDRKVLAEVIRDHDRALS
jgi:hypothetical protein